MSSRKPGLFYTVLIVFVSLVAGMVLASRLDLTPRSLAGGLAVPPTNSAPLTGALDASTFRTIAHDRGPAVVSVQIVGHRQAPSIDDFFGLQNPGGGNSGRRRGGGSGGRQSDVVPVAGAGSGFVIDKAGFILTNNHVIDEAEEITVTFGDQATDEQWPAKVIGRDQLTDVALIQLTKLPPEPLTPVEFGDSSQIAPGDFVLAIGNPFQLANTVTMGVVSSVSHPRTASQSAGGSRSEPMIQTDAAINRGNSGGPLFNIRGEVVGINEMIYSDESGGNIGIGFAIPINRVRDILPQLRTGKVTRGRIGVTVGPITRQNYADFGLSSVMGTYISSVTPGGPAANAGLKINDVVVEFNGRPVKDRDDLISMVTATAPGTSVPVKVLRDRKPMTLTVKIEELDLAAEQQEGTAPQTSQRNNPQQAPPETQNKGFGMTISEIDARTARQLELPANTKGVVVTDVEDFSAAQQAGLSRGDVITAVDGTPVATTAQASAALDKVESGRNARLVVVRSGQEQLVLVRKR